MTLQEENKKIIETLIKNTKDRADSALQMT